MSATGQQVVAGDVAAIVAAPLPWHRLSGARVAVTGASGFLGAYLARALLALHPAGLVAEPVRVTGVVRNLAKARARFADLPATSQPHWLQCDLAHESERLQDTLEADWIVHAASPATPKVYGSDPLGTLAPNVLGTWHLLQAAQRSGARGFLFVSTSEVYGAAGAGGGHLREQDYGSLDPASVRSAYAESKRLGETMCVAWMHQHRLPVHIARLFHTYGPGVDLEDGRVFADFVADVVAGRPVRLSSDGSARRAFCYVSDAVAGLFHVLLKGEPGLPYNIANPAGDLSIRALAQLLVEIARECGRPVSLAAKELPPGYMPSPHANLLPAIERARAIGWEPRVDPATGFRRMVESYL